MKNTINQLWEHYRTKVMSPKAPPIQVHECQLAFCAGAFSLLGEILKIGNSAASENERAARLQDFIDELGSFVDML